MFSVVKALMRLRLHMLDESKYVDAIELEIPPPPSLDKAYAN